MKFVVRYLILWHRWLGIFTCCLFMLWFATGLVLHFVHFPELTTQERYAGLKPIESQSVKLTLYQAIHTLPYFERIDKVKLVMSGNRPVYIIHHDENLSAIYADTGGTAGPLSNKTVLNIGRTHAQQRSIAQQGIAYSTLQDVDQWTVSNGLDAYRPLHKVALNDALQTELYVSDVTGEVVRDTTQKERVWNYAGAVIHWIYPTVLRKHWATWNWLVWVVSLIALVSVVSGIILGFLRIRWKQSRRDQSISPYRGLPYLHHLSGIAVAAFLFTYIFSGWLSMDHGLLFSSNSVSLAEREVLAGGVIHWQRFNAIDLSMAEGAKQLEWVQLAGKPYVIATFSDRSQTILSSSAGHESSVHENSNKQSFAVSDFTKQSAQLSGQTMCSFPFRVAESDAYFTTTAMPHLPLLRIVCDDKKKTWFHIDSSNAQLIEKMDSSRRWYRWLYSGLHTLDFPILNTHPQLQTALVILFCILGFLFSLTGVTLAWRRLGFNQ